MANITPQAGPIVISRLVHARPTPDLILATHPEDALEFHIPLVENRHPDLRYGEKRVAAGGACRPGWSYLVDLNAGPTLRLDQPLDHVCVYMSRATLNALAYENGRRRVRDIAQPSFGAPDPVMFHLAQTLLPALASPETASRLFVEYVSLAFYEHIIATYGSLAAAGRRRRASLTSWQVRRVTDCAEATLAASPSIADLARECNLSASHFSSAFRHTFGVTPHQWLLKRRVERAKTMLRNTEASLASIASDCGFSDQSHFSRVFARFEHDTPSDWRRRHHPLGKG
ncbi:AraC family transcriptional regulator [Acetobacteraceae bacterium KSS8]|uniref:AraC family transcriptional regulator n=1 Tax=Endosaccharibacter trunci TaxID=2812733 RepID=A0ABT1W437_9PROT|nr:AraC family transcriptional regulator [Acetobacteraceae bacterium KSS8]